MKESWSVRFLYQTIPGRMILKLMVHPAISHLGGRVLSTKVSRHIVPYYIKKNHINLAGVIIPQGGFASFNDFFTRKRIEKMMDEDNSTMISPCDAYLSAVRIDENTVFHVKNTDYKLADLLKNEELAKRYEGGYGLIFRLTPNHYHRYCYSVSGRLRKYRRISGILHCVRPVALATNPVFIQNTREYQVISHKEYGHVIQMEIGALMVGKIVNYKDSFVTGETVLGMEKGYFEFGGSTIMLVLEKQVPLREDILSLMDLEEEISIKMGDNLLSV
ncbi:MAG: phosphatidylserine decarboxylase [Eubacteriales bacterium]|nr:phosphatidylserine decarboxylase [Eubacteriales bacterium]